jgi:hypothetical protein
MDHHKFQGLIKQLYAIVSELESIFPGRHFTPDGQCLVADAYGLELKMASNKGFDAIASDGKEVEIKATQSKSVAFRSEPEHTIIISILPNGTFEEAYNGPGSLVWQQFSGKKLPSNGQFQISLNKLKELNKQVSDSSRVSRIA